MLIFLFLLAILIKPAGQLASQFWSSCYSLSDRFYICLFKNIQRRLTNWVFVVQEFFMLSLASAIVHTGVNFLLNEFPTFQAALNQFHRNRLCKLFMQKTDLNLFKCRFSNRTARKTNAGIPNAHKLASFFIQRASLNHFKYSFPNAAILESNVSASNSHALSSFNWLRACLLLLRSEGFLWADIGCI